MNLNDLPIVRQRLADPATRQQAAIELGDWVRALCLLFGAELMTAQAVGAHFAVGLEKSWSEPEAAPQ